MEVNELIRQRRAIYPKEFNGERIDDSVITDLLENAHWAPSHGHIFPWKFKVFNDDSLVPLTNKMAELYEKYTPETKFRPGKPDQLRSNADKCSHIIAICYIPSGKYPETEEICAVACAVQNLWLSLGKYDDIGGYWSTGGGTFTPDMNDFLNLDGGARCLGLFMLGKVDAKRTNGHRPPLDPKVEWM